MTLKIIGDQGRTFSAVAEGACSGGFFALAGSYTNTLSTYDESSWAPTVCKVGNTGSGTNCVGVLMQDQTSGTSNLVTVLRTGLVLCNAVGNVNVGAAVVAAGDGANAGAVAPITAGAEHAVVGRAINEAASGGLVWINLNV